MKLFYIFSVNFTIFWKFCTISTRNDSFAGLPHDSPHHPSESGGLLSDWGRPILGPTLDDTEAGYSTPKDVREMKEWVSF